MGNVACVPKCASKGPQSPPVSPDPSFKKVKSWIDDATIARSPLATSSLTNTDLDLHESRKNSGPILVVPATNHARSSIRQGLSQRESPSAAVLSLPPVLAHCGWRGIGRLAVSGALGKSALASEDAWHAVCMALGQEAALHVPNEIPLRGWKWLFWEHLWPARGT